MRWLQHNSAAIQAVAAAVTALTAILAVAGVALQLQAADATSRAQTAREAYAAHLALSVANPDFAAPADTCVLLASAKGAAYEAFVDHLLYAAEQMLAVEAGWEPTFETALAPHAALVCASASGDVQATLSAFRDRVCTGVPACPTED